MNHLENLNKIVSLINNKVILVKIKSDDYAWGYLSKEDKELTEKTLKEIEAMLVQFIR